MNSSYLFPIWVGVLIFPALAFVITTPYIVFNYRKYGSVSGFRTFIIYSFVLYLEIALFLVILPLPKIEEVAKLTTPIMNLVPFSFVSDFINHSNFVLNDPKTYFLALKSPEVYTVLFNVLLTVPFGMYLRYYFKCSLKKTFVFSFLLSLTFELIQLSALFGIYPRPYRLFDVDDLLVNTLGGVLGYLIFGLLKRILPSREMIDEKAYLKGKRVSYSRRVLAFVVDYLILAFVIFNNFNFIFNFLIIIGYFSLTALVFKGKSLGKMLVKIRVVKEDGEDALFYQYILRYGVFYGSLFLASVTRCLLEFFHLDMSVLIFFFVFYYLFYFNYLIISIFTKKDILFYDKFSKTKLVSYVKK